MKDVRFDNIKLNDNALADRLNSYQFKLSQDIFGKRISLNISRNEAAKLTGLTEDEYTKIEQGIDLKSSKEKYQSVLTKLINASKPHSSRMDSFTVQINVEGQKIPSIQNFESLARYSVR